MFQTLPQTLMLLPPGSQFPIHYFDFYFTDKVGFIRCNLLQPLLFFFSVSIYPPSLSSFPVSEEDVSFIFFYVNFCSFLLSLVLVLSILSPLFSSTFRVSLPSGSSVYKQDKVLPFPQTILYTILPAPLVCNLFLYLCLDVNILDNWYVTAAPISLLLSLSLISSTWLYSHYSK